MANPNLELLRGAAKLLRPIVDELVFVGGCTTGLLISDEASADVRPTFDVDVISEITSYADYVNLSERLLELGFTPDISDGAPLCRWLHGETKLDVMPLDEKILGFSNRWYQPAMLRVGRSGLPSGRRRLRFCFSNAGQYDWLTVWEFSDQGQVATHGFDRLPQGREQQIAPLLESRDAILSDAERFRQPHLGEFAGLPEFLQGHFFGNQGGSAGLDLLAARGTDTFHFLFQGLHG
jgi:hypothetical protein